ncbi:hypothetical protein [Pseudomonas entomophila]|uniref:hypothetical protein n=1 Tax=Pseudomonas entomophila TaxID=312306 RepID=UPI002158B9C4|nr:hypothetical protein [Pseudomonas entomophila]
MQPVVGQDALDSALIAFARYKIGETKFSALERAMSFEVGEALSRSEWVRFSISKLPSGRYRIADEGENAITEAGRAHLAALRASQDYRETQPASHAVTPLLTPGQA